MIELETVETAASYATAASDVAAAFLAGVDEAREAYIADSKSTLLWRQYTHAMDQHAAAEGRAHAARELHRAVAHAYNLAQAWERCRRLPLVLNAVPTQRTMRSVQ